MYGLDIDLLYGSQRHSAHAGQPPYLCQCCGIVEVVLLRLHKGPNVLSRDQSNIVPMTGRKPSQVLCSAAGLDRDDAGGIGRKQPVQLLASELLAKQHTPCITQPHDMKPPLPDINPECHSLHGVSFCGEAAAVSDYAERTIPLVADQLVNGTRFRALTIVDVYTREALAIAVGQRPKAEDVVGVCNKLVARRGSPVRIFVDNGSEFSGRVFDLWAYHQKATIDFNRPGKPTDNCFVESFNGSFRDECLNVHWFETIDDACLAIATVAWLLGYN